MKRIKSVLLAWGIVALGAVSSSATAQQLSVQVEYPTLEREQNLVFKQPVRFADVLAQSVFLLPETDQVQLYWPGSRLSSDKLQERLLQQRADVVNELKLLASYWTKRGRNDISRSVTYLMRELEQMNLLASYYFAIEPDRVRVRLQNNPFLSRAEGASFVLRVPSVDEGIVSFGLSPKDPAADTQWQWQIALNGDIKRTPVGLSNRHENAHCYEHTPSQPLSVAKAKLCEPGESLTQGKVFRGLSENVVPEQWQSINRRIAEIVKHQS